MGAHSLHLEKLPPAPSTVHLDDYQFANRENHAVASRYVGAQNGINGWESNGLGFDDYARCQTSRRSLNGNVNRRIRTPKWAINDSDLQQVLVAYLERRAWGHGKQWRYYSSLAGLSLADRLKRADEKLRSNAEYQTKTLDRLCGEYVELKKTGGDPSRIKMLESQISTLDTTVIINRDAPKVIATIIYLYYRQGLQSVGVAAETGLKSPAIRQLLFRLWIIAKSLGFESEVGYEYKKRTVTSA